MTLEEARKHIGDRVIYTPFEGCAASELEFGIITSVNDSYVFVVRYANDTISKATHSSNLRLW